MSAYRDAGARAKQRGMSRDRNPYRPESKKAIEWDEGWLGMTRERALELVRQEPRRVSPMGRR